MSTASLDELRQCRSSSLDARDQVYLDYTGAGLFAQSQVRAHLELLRRTCLATPLRQPEFQLVDVPGRGRATIVFAYSNASEDYAAIFTLNASAALKLVGESYALSPAAGAC